MSFLKKIFPDDPTSYKGSNLAFYGLILFTGILIWRSFIHFLFWEFGLHDVANIKPILGSPEPMTLIYLFFSLWGLQQVIRTFLTILVLFKYKGFIPANCWNRSVSSVYSIFIFC